MYKEEGTDQLPSVNCSVQVHAEFHGGLQTRSTTAKSNYINRLQSNYINRLQKSYKNDTGYHMNRTSKNHKESIE